MHWYSNSGQYYTLLIIVFIFLFFFGHIVWDPTIIGRPPVVLPWARWGSHTSCLSGFVSFAHRRPIWMLHNFQLKVLERDNDVWPSASHREEAVSNVFALRNGLYTFAKVKREISRTFLMIFPSSVLVIVLCVVLNLEGIKNVRNVIGSIVSWLQTGPAHQHRI